MSDRLTQLQDTVNLVRTIVQASVYLIESKFLTRGYFFSKRNIFAIALASCNNALFRANFRDLNALVLNNHLKIHKRTTHNYFQR